VSGSGDAPAPIAIDTSVAVPLLVATHHEHATIVKWRSGRTMALSGHALVETYSVLTRLPGDLRLEGADAARLLATRFEAPLTLSESTMARLAELLAARGVVGGAVYDALVALAAVEHGARLATRDERAAATYESLGACVIRAR
jgi:predicted nucleic acid-binding protein